MSFKPLLAEVADLRAVKYPVYASVKIDGIRTLVKDGKALSRKLIRIPNVEIQKVLEHSMYEGFDGELTVGDPTAPDCFNATTRTVMKAGKELDPSLRYWVFDRHDLPGWQFGDRLEKLMETQLAIPDMRVQVLAQRWITCEDDLLEFENKSVEDGWEGIMIRSPYGPYKHGRSTLNEGILLKVKRFVDSEAEIIGVVEGMTNTNAAQKDELGHTKRSSAKAGKVASGTLGALMGRDLKTGVEFRCGTGMSNDEAAHLWSIRDQLPGKIFKYTYQQVGVLNKPRFPSYKGLRDPRDMS